MTQAIAGSGEALADDALVLGGGGLSGIAWMTGLLHGFAEAGAPLAADRIIGTSAGSAVGALLALGTPTGEMFARQVEPARQVAEIGARLPVFTLLRIMLTLRYGRGSEEARRARVGALALAAQTPDPAARRAVIADRLGGVETWPEAAFVCTAIDADSGELIVLDRKSGVSLIDAVAASCAVASVWPVVPLGSRRAYDGGFRSGENADLAAGAARVTILAPMLGARPSKLLAAQIAGLKAAGSAVRLIGPDPASRSAMGRKALDPAVRLPSARAGFAQGQAQAQARALAGSPAES